MKPNDQVLVLDTTTNQKEFYFLIKSNPPPRVSKMKFAFPKRLKNPFRYKKMSKDVEEQKQNQIEIVEIDLDTVVPVYGPYDEVNASKVDQLESRDASEKTTMAENDEREEGEASQETLEDDLPFPSPFNVCFAEFAALLCDPRNVPMIEEETKPRLTGAHIFKSHPEDKIGMTIKSSSQNEGIFINSVGISSRVKSDSSLMGMRIVSINGAYPKTIQEATELIAKAEGDLKFIAANPNDKEVMEEEKEESNYFFARDRSILCKV